MNFTRYSPFFIVSVAFSLNANAQQAPQQSAISQCPVPDYTKIAPLVSPEPENAYKIISQSSSITKGKYAEFSGGVVLVNEEQRIQAEQLSIDRDNAAIEAQGNIHFQNQSINIFADRMTADGDQQSTSLHGGKYQLTNNPGNGGADEIIILAQGQLSLQDSTFTTCVGDSPDWVLEASEIELSDDETFGKAYHARFKVFDVPVFYIPYYSFPITDERTTGFLYPKASTSSRSGFEMETPFYWNIAPNMDATITPHLMSKRGLQLKTEFRYLVDEQAGVIDLEYLNKDNDLANNNDPRYLARFQHSGTFSDNYRVYVDVSTISDDNYLADIGSKHYNANDAYLYQIAELAYFGESWQAVVKAQDFEVLGYHQPNYKVVPQIELSSELPLDFLNGYVDLYSELSRFETENDTLPEASRYHFEAGLNFPITRPAWFVNSEFKLMQTFYQQEKIPVGSELEDNVSRTIPKARIHGGINFDRETTFLGSGYTQTLEPQVQYLYIPEVDQTNIGVYDTTQLQDDYNGLFRDRRFSGLDRIEQANQLSWGVTSRLLDPSNRELFHISLGQIAYLNNNYTSDADNPDLTVSESALAAEIFLSINRQWQFSGDIQYDTENSNRTKSQINVDYHFDEKNMVQLNHRYSLDVSGNTLEQVSLLTSLGISDNWQFVGRVTQDIQQKRSLEGYAGFQYDSCCWSVRFAYHRYIVTNFEENSSLDENRNEFEKGFMIEFDIKTQDIEEMFNESIFGYKRPYFLNN